jgi:ribosomal protein S14
MAQQTISISNGKRKSIVVKSKSNFKISRSLITPEANVKRTKSVTILHENLPSKQTRKDDLCTHCGVRQKGPGFRFLCRYCFRKAGEETVYSISSGTTNRDMSSRKISW